MSGSLHTVGIKYHWVFPNELKENDKSTSAHFEAMIDPNKMRYIGVVRFGGMLKLLAIAAETKEPVNTTWCQQFNIPFEYSMRPEKEILNPKMCYEHMKKLAVEKNVKYEEHGTWPYKICQNKEKTEESGLKRKSKEVLLRIKRKAFFITKESKKPVSTEKSQKHVSTADSQQPVSTADSQQPVSTTESQEAVSTTESQQPVSTTESQEAVSTTVRIDLSLRLAQRLKNSKKKK